jgi:hypothetical protein
MEEDVTWSRVHAGLEIQDFGNFPAWDGVTPPKDGDTWIIALEMRPVKKK